MPVDSSGNITRPSSPIPVTGQTADAPQVNVPIDDMINSMNMFMFLDGRKPLRGNIPMNGYRSRGAADAEQPQDYVTLAQLQSALSGAATVPTGVIMSHTGTSAPSGWVLANGQSLSRATFPNLWAFVQSSGNLAASEGAKQAGQYGPGNGSTTFTVPNLGVNGGYFIRPISSGRNIGSVQADDIKSHTHTGVTNSAGAHSHTYPGPATALPTGSNRPSGSGGTGVLPTSTAGAHTHQLSINSTGGTETRPKNIAYPFIIKA